MTRNNLSRCKNAWSTKSYTGRYISLGRC